MSEQFAFCTLIIVFLISSIHTLTAEVEDYVAYVSLSEVGYIGMVFVVGSEFISIAFFYSVVAFFPIVEHIVDDGFARCYNCSARSKPTFYLSDVAGLTVCTHLACLVIEIVVFRLKSYCSEVLVGRFYGNLVHFFSSVFHLDFVYTFLNLIFIRYGGICGAINNNFFEIVAIFSRRSNYYHIVNLKACTYVGMRSCGWIFQFNLVVASIYSLFVREVFRVCIGDGIIAYHIWQQWICCRDRFEMPMVVCRPFIYECCQGDSRLVSFVGKGHGFTIC